MQFALELDNEFSALGGDLGLLPDFQLPCLPRLLVDSFALLRLLHHHLQFLPKRDSRLAGLLGGSREALHDAVDLLRHLEDALLDLRYFCDDLPIVISEFAELFCVLGLYGLESFFFLLCHVAVIGVLIAADLVLLSWYRLETPNLNIERLAENFLDIWAHCLGASVAEDVDAIAVMAREQIGDRGPVWVVAMAHDSDLRLEYLVLQRGNRRLCLYLPRPDVHAPPLLLEMCLFFLHELEQLVLERALYRLHGLHLCLQPLIHAILHVDPLLLQVCYLFVQDILHRALAGPVRDCCEVVLVLSSPEVWT